jgi:hypothetical protein
MSKVSNKQIAVAFRAARKRIKSGYEDYICLALDGAELCGEIDSLTYLQAKRIIEDRMQLPPHYSLEHWLSKNVPEYSQFLSTEPSIDRRNEQRKKYRLRWLDALIEEFENK